MNIKGIFQAAALAALVACASTAAADEGFFPERAEPGPEHVSAAIAPKSFLCGLFLSGGWNYTLEPEFSGGPRVTVFGPASPNDLRIVNTFTSCYNPTGTLRLEYWIATNGNQPLSQGGAFIGTRIAIFPNNGQLFQGQQFVNVNGSAAYSIPAYGQYWLILYLAHYQPGTCGSADGFCYSDSYVSAQMVLIGNNTLSVAKNGTGGGTVTGIVNRTGLTKISCGATCQASIFGGDNVTLSAAPNGGSVFAGWSGGGCSGTGTCTVSMANSPSVTATFNIAPPVTYTLTVTKSGNGTVTSSPAGINCGATCSAIYNSGTAVALTATPSVGYNFSGWTLDCAGTGTCNVTMSGNRNVTALFTQLPVIPTTSKARSDFNNDRKSDILYRNSSTGQLYRMLMNGLAISGAAVAHTEPNLAWNVVQEGDFNFDGSTDLLWRNASTGQVYMQLFNGSGLPGSGAVFHVEPSAAWKIVATPDLDGDNKADILWWNSSTGTVWAMLMDGPAITAQGVVHAEPDTAWRIAAVGDFAGSGRRNQLVWHHAVDGRVYLMTVNRVGGGFTTSGQIIHAEPNLQWQILAAADANADGKSDLYWRNESTGQVYLMVMNGPAIASQGQIYVEPNLLWQVVAIGDYDGNNRADLLFRHEMTGQVYMMLRDGFSVLGGSIVYTEPNTAWKVLGQSYLE
jgi:uncharacterized repeat protein (TIGR02543 family)